MLIVVSMHRSGSSLLTGMLADNGYYCGPAEMLVAAEKSNPKGFFELDAVNQLNEQIIASDSATHLLPNVAPSGSVVVPDEKISQLLKRLDGLGVSVLKDPRFCLTLQHWLKHFEQPKVIYLFRDPLAVAKSLAARHDYPIPAGLALWEFYNRQALKNTRAVARHFVNFDDLVQQPDQVLAEIEAWLGSVNESATNFKTQFFDQALINHAYADTKVDELDSSQLEVYQALCNSQVENITEQCGERSLAVMEMISLFAGRGYDVVTGRLVDQQAQQAYQQLSEQMMALQSKHRRMQQLLTNLLDSRGAKLLQFLYSAKRALFRQQSDTAIESLTKHLPAKQKMR